MSGDLYNLAKSFSDMDAKAERRQYLKEHPEAREIGRPIPVDNTRMPPAKDGRYGKYGKVHIEPYEVPAKQRASVRLANGILKARNKGEYDSENNKAREDAKRMLESLSEGYIIARRKL